MNWQILLVGILGVTLFGLGLLGVNETSQSNQIWKQDPREKLVVALDQSGIEVDEQVLTLVNQKPEWIQDVASDLYPFDDDIMVLDTLFYYQNKLVRISQFVVKPSTENPQLSVANPFLYCWEVNGDSSFQENHCLLDLRENTLNGDEVELENWLSGWGKSLG